MQILIKYITILSAVLFAVVITASAEAQWAEPVSSEMHTGGVLNNGDYSVKASQFSQPVLGVRDINGNIVPRDDFESTVFLELFKNGLLINEFTLTLSDNTFVTADEEIKVTLTDILPQHSKEWVYEYYNPWAKIEVSLRGLPEFKISVDTDQNTYTSNRDDIIHLKVGIENRGEGDIENVKVSISTEDLSLVLGKQKNLNPSYPIIKVGEEKTVELELKVPSTILNPKKYILSASASGYDKKNIYYENYNYTVIAIVPPDDIILNKYIKDRIYMSETATVILKLTNTGVFEVTNISVHDSVPVNFELQSNTSLDWEIARLSPGEEKVIGSYEIKPLYADINGYVLPSSRAAYIINDDVFSVESESPRVVVNGPRIIVEKIAPEKVSAGDDIEVTVTVYNMGNAPTKVSIIDQVPKDSMLVKGNTSLPQTFLDYGDSLKISYVMRIFSQGNYTLPDAVAEYLDISNSRSNINSKAYSTSVNISVGQRGSTIKPQSTSFPVFISRTPVGKISTKDSNKIPGFGNKLLSIYILIIYFMLNNKMRNKKT